MTIRTVNLGLVSNPNGPAVNNLRGGNPAKRHHVKQMLSAQDQPLVASRRIVIEGGLRGYNTNAVDDTTLSATSDQIKAHPLSTDEKIIGRVKDYKLTPGHVLAVSVRALPSAHAPFLVSAEPLNFYYDGGQDGQLKIESTWSSPGETDADVDLELVFAEPGNTQFGHCGHATQSGFSQVQEKYTLLLPSAMLYDPSAVEKYCREGVEVDITISRVGGLRLVDFAIWEIPYKAAFDDSTSNTLPAHVYANNELPLTNYPPEFVLEGAATGDPRLGTEWANDVMLAQTRSINPTLLTWSAEEEAETWTTTEDGGLALPSGALDLFTFDASALAYGQRFHNSNSVVMPNTGCVLVEVQVRMIQVNADFEIYLIDEAGDEVAHMRPRVSTDGAEYDSWSFLLECGAGALDAVRYIFRTDSDSSSGKLMEVAIRVLPEN